MKKALSLTAEETESLRKLFSFRRDNAVSKESLNALQPKKPKAPTIFPYVTVRDLNNHKQTDDTSESPPKRAVEVGVKWSF